MTDQVLIKSLIILGLIAIAARLVIPGGGSRTLAVRRLLILGFFSLAAVAVVFPELLSAFASFLGVGRGTDLLLYLLIVIFLEHLISSSKQRRRLETSITALARIEALKSATGPEENLTK